MRILRSAAVLVAFSVTLSAPGARAEEKLPVDKVHVKEALAATMTPAELAAHKQKMAKLLATKVERSTIHPLTPADTCLAATYEVSALPFNPAADTTAGQVDNYDLPPDVVDPTCTAATTCTGTGPAGSLPRGAIYTGTGTGPDRAYKIRTDSNCNLTISMDPTSSQDLALIVYQAACSSSLADCACVSDTGIGGAVESISLSAVAGVDYFVVVDGYSTGGTPPGPSGPFTLSITGSGCSLVDPNAVVAPDLALTKTDGGASVVPGGTVAYTLAYTNSGAAATGVVLTETVPANTTFSSVASTAGWSCVPDANAGSTCTLAIGAVAGAGSGNATFAVTVVNPVAAGVTQVSNTASVADDGLHGADPTPANNSASDTTPVDAAPDLTLTKSDGGATVLPGGTAVYTLSYANAGNQGATGVVLTETVPAESTFDAVSSTAGWACAPDANAGSTCTLTIGALAGGGANGSATFAVTVANPPTAGTTQISNTASVADDAANGADPTPADNTAADTTPLGGAPDLTLTKTASSGFATPGGTIAYTLAYANVGDRTATGVALTDTVPANTTFDPVASTAGWSCLPDGNAGGVCTLSLGALAPAASGSATFAVIVASPLGAGFTSISNTASIADDGVNGVDPTPANGTSTAAVSVLGERSIPTLSTWALGLLAALLVGIGLRKLAV